MRYKLFCAIASLFVLIGGADAQLLQRDCSNGQCRLVPVNRPIVRQQALQSTVLPMPVYAPIVQPVSIESAPAFDPPQPASEWIVPNPEQSFPVVPSPVYASGGSSGNVTSAVVTAPVVTSYDSTMSAGSTGNLSTTTYQSGWTSTATSYQTVQPMVGRRTGPVRRMVQRWRSR